MRQVRRAAVSGLFALWLAPLPVLAGSEASDSSSNCSSGRCARVDTLVIEERHFRRGWVREERWREGGPHRAREAFWPGLRLQPGPRPARPHRDDDDD